MQWFADFINDFNTKMPTPTWFGWFHIMWIVICIASCVLIYIFRKRISKRAIKITLLTTGILLLVLEIFKQLKYSLNYNDGNSYWVYQPFIFPFQFCSTPMYLMILAGILGKGKVYDSILCYLATFAFFGGTTVLIYPNEVFTTTIFINMHSMFWHSSMIVIGFLILATRSIDFKLKSAAKDSIVFAVMICLALVMNISAHYIKPGVNFNMFYIGPYIPCNLVILSTIYTIVPWIVFFFIYFLGFALVSFVIILVAIGCKRLDDKIHKNNEIDLVEIIKKPL